MPARHALSSLFALVLVLAASQLAASDWPHLRGPAFDGRAPAPADLESGELGLEMDWRVPLGSGYSGIAVAGGRVVTLFADGDSDWVAAFDLDSGSELWRHRLDSVNRGRDGSADGPLGSPTIDQGRVFALGAKGQLVGLDLEKGRLLWQKSMADDFGAEEPDFGFGVTPLVVEDRLIVLTGGESGAITALDPATGERLWSTGEGSYGYEIPVMVGVDGGSYVAIGEDRVIYGIDPADGAIAWTHAVGEDEEVGGLSVVGDDRLVAEISGQIAMFELVGGVEGVSVTELYRTRDLGGTYASPVYHEEHLYGFRGQILSCVNASNGELVWRSRPPGGRGLILVGDQLVIFGAGGHVVLVDATPEGYRERARLKALDASGYTWPSFAGGRVLVRNLEELAAVRLGREDASDLAQSEAPAGKFGRFLAELAESEDKAPRIESFLTESGNMPLVEGNVAHFVYNGEAEDMAIVGTMIRSGSTDEMYRVPGTDLYHRSYEIEPGGRWEYQLVRNYGERLVDPLNERTAPARQGSADVSEFWLPGYVRPEHLVNADSKAPGRVEELRFTSEIQGFERKVHVYLPPDYWQSTEPTYPLLIVHDGKDWLEKGHMVPALDHLIDGGSRPLIVALLEARDEWWEEAGGTGTDEHVEMLVGELLPLLQRNYRIIESPESRGLMGNTGFGLTSAYAALKHPELFGKVAIQSVQLGLGYEDALMALLGDEPRPEIDFYLDWSRYEVRNLDAGIDLSVDNLRLAEALRAAGYDFAGGEVGDSAGWAGWSARTDRVLEALFPN